MPTPAEDLEVVALQLPRDQRASLAERLIASLDEVEEIEEAWAAEIRRRVEKLRSGAVKALDASEVFNEL